MHSFILMPLISHGLLIAAVCATSDCAADSTVADQALAEQRWAIVSGVDQKDRNLADLLTVQLSAVKGVELVERSEIRKVLDELRLNASGLVEPAKAVQFGRLLAADAILFMERNADAQPPTLRVRLLETRSGVRLLDLLAPADDLVKEIETLIRELDQARTKLAVPDERRRYVGMLGVRNEEPGELLTPVARALSVLLEHDLGQTPGTIVLEREQLSHLTAERELTGIELRLRASTRLIEMGLRRDSDGQGLLIRGKIHGLGDGTVKDFELKTSSQELPAIRQPALEVITRALESPDAVLPSADVRSEAALFAKRRDWLERVRRFEEAEVLAEAALALSPSPENILRTLVIYHLDAHRRDSEAKHSLEALRAARRHHELRLDGLRKTRPGDAFRLQLLIVARPLEPHVRISIDGETEEVQQLRAEVDRLSLDLFREIYEAPETNTHSKLDLLQHRLHYAAFIAETGSEFGKAVFDVLIEFNSQIVQLEANDAQRSQRLDGLIEELGRQISQSRENCRRDGHASDQRNWQLEELVPVWRELAQNDHPHIRLMGKSGLTMLADAEGVEAARVIGREVRSMAKSDRAIPGFVDDWLWKSHRRLPKDEFHSSYEAVLVDLEKSLDAAKMLRFSRTIGIGLVDADLELAGKWGHRVLRMLDWHTHSDEQAQSANNLRLNVVQLLQDRDLITRQPLTTHDGPGPWQQYVATPIPLENPSAESHQLHSVYVDRSESARERDEQLLLVWGKKNEQLSVERMNLGTTARRKFGPDIAGYPVPFRGIQIAVAGNTLFIASKPPGFSMLREDAVENLDSRKGAPGDTVQTLAWLDGRLYITYPNAIASFDPSNRQFELISSSSSLEPRNPLDGGDGYQILHTLADPKNHCFWMNVQSNSNDPARNGTWRFEPAGRKFERIHDSLATLSWCDDRILLQGGRGNPWWELDPSSGTVTKLDGYAPWQVRDENSFSWQRFAKVGQHIVGADGQIYTPDGLIHQLPITSPWFMLQRAGPGFVTHYDRKTNQLWYVTPK